MSDNTDQTLEFERGLCSAYLCDPTTVQDLNVSASDFSEGPLEGFGLLFSVINNLIETGLDPNDPSAIFEAMYRRLKQLRLNDVTYLERIGGTKTITDICEFSKINFGNITYYAQKIKDASTLRKARFIGQQLLTAESHDEIERHAEGLAVLNAEVTNVQQFQGVAAAELRHAASEPIDWIIRYVFSSDQPTLFGARSKAGKTTQLVDLSVALATATEWLGYFAVEKTKKVLLITGEANERAIARRIEKALTARGLSFDALGDRFRVETMDFPILPSVADQRQITRIVEKYNFEVVIVDPLYRGLCGLDTNRMAEVGQAIVQFANACRPASLIISHHSTKAAARGLGEPPELEDMTGAGIAESCGNWWLLGRNEKYESDGLHDLCVRYGGRDEQSGQIRILFNENDWTFEVEKLSEYRDRAKEEKRDKDVKAKSAKIEKELADAESEILTALRNEKTPLPKCRIHDLCPTASQQKHRTAFARLLKQMTIVERPYHVKLGAGKREQMGFIHRDYAKKYDEEYQQQKAK